MKKVNLKSHRSSLSRHQDRKALEERRLKAVEFFKKGIKRKKIAQILGVSCEAIRLWHEAWKKEGIEGLKSKGKPGPKPRLTDEKKEKVKEVLLQGPQSFGWTTNIWTLKRITQAIKKVTGVKFHPGYVWWLLKGMGWSCQKPRIRSKYRNESMITSWKKKIWPIIKKGGKN